MGICSSQKQPIKGGELHQVCEKLKENPSSDRVIRDLQGNGQNLNPYLNPILNRRLHSVSIQQTQYQKSIETNLNS